MAGETDKKTGEEEEVEYVAVEEEDPKEKKGSADEEHEESEEEEELEEEEEEEGEETRLGGGREEEEDEDPARKKQRDLNQKRRKRQKTAKERTERELKFLQGRNAELEQRFSHFEQETDARVTGSEIANVEGAISKAKSDLMLANQVIEQSLEQKDGKNLTEALDHRDTIRDNLRDLEEAKGYLANADRAAATQKPMDPRHQAHANSFMIDHDWWDPNARDTDSKKVLTLDRALVEEGFDPKTKVYWDTLRERVKDEFPDRFEAEAGADDEKGDKAGKKKLSKKQSSGPAFRTGGRERPLKKNEVYISPDRKNAMIEAGVWEDPVLRNKYLKSYADYDRQAAEGQGA